MHHEVGFVCRHLATNAPFPEFFLLVGKNRFRSGLAEQAANFVLRHARLDFGQIDCIAVG
jgi:hypothetical protein